MSAVIQPSYKRTEIGEIPENWDVVRLGSVIQEGRHIRYGVVQPGKLTSNGCFMLRSQDYSKGWSDTDGMHRLSKQLEAQFKNAKLKTGDLVMTVVGAGIGQIEIIPDWLDGAILSRSTARIGIDNSKAEPAFVRYFLESPTAKRQILDCQKEGAQPVVSCPDLACFHIALPSIEEQIKIASALTEVDTLIRKLDQLVTKKRDIQQATMQQLLTGQRRLPGFSGEWELKQLGDVLRVRHGRDQKDVESSDGAYPILATGGEIGRTDTPLYEKPSVLIGRKGTIDRPMYRDTPFWTVDTLFYTEIGSTVVAKFIYYRFLIIDWYSYNEASGVPSLNAATIENIEVQLPDVTEQAAIATILSDMDTELVALEARRDKAHQIKQGMMQELLTGRIRLSS